MSRQTQSAAVHQVGNHALQISLPTITMRVRQCHRDPALYRFDGGNFQQFLQLTE
jgi:hypothetical protein